MAAKKVRGGGDKVPRVHFCENMDWKDMIHKYPSEKCINETASDLKKRSSAVKSNFAVKNLSSSYHGQAEWLQNNMITYLWPYFDVLAWWIDLGRRILTKLVPVSAIVLGTLYQCKTRKGFLQSHLGGWKLGAETVSTLSGAEASH